MTEYIERDKVLAKAAPVEGCFSNMISTYDVASIPTADVVEVRHGRWIDNAIAFAEKCSVCGKGVYWDGDNYHRYTFCPNCGALMDGKSCVPRGDGE